MDFCFRMEALRNALIQILNESGLSVGAAFFVLRDVHNTLYLSYLDEIKRETESPSKEEKHETTIDLAEVMENGEQNND